MANCSTWEGKHMRREDKESWEEKSQDTAYWQGFKKDWHSYERIRQNYRKK